MISRMSKKKRARLVRVTVTMARELANQLAAIALERDLSMSFIVRVGVRHWLASGAPMDGAVSTKSRQVPQAR
jgi:hypothetical protein